MDGTDEETPGEAPPSRAESLSAHAEESISEDAILAGARERAVDIGAGAVTPAVGALLSLLAKLSGGKAVAEVGTGAGVSGLWLLSGMSDDGVLSCLDVKTGKRHFQQRVGGNFSSSFLYADGRIYIPSEQGLTTVVKPGHAYEVLAENQLPGRIFASIAPYDGALFLRTEFALYRIQNK